jgi:hypothetical protein
VASWSIFERSKQNDSVIGQGQDCIVDVVEPQRVLYQAKCGCNVGTFIAMHHPSVMCIVYDHPHFSDNVVGLALVDVRPEFFLVGYQVSPFCTLVFVLAHNVGSMFHYQWQCNSKRCHSHGTSAENGYRCHSGYGCAVPWVVGNPSCTCSMEVKCVMDDFKVQRIGVISHCEVCKVSDAMRLL